MYRGDGEMISGGNYGLVAVQHVVLLSHSSIVPGLVLSVWSFVCPPSVLVGFLQVLLFLPTSPKHSSSWTCKAKLPLEVNEHVHGSL